MIEDSRSELESPARGAWYTVVVLMLIYMVNYIDRMIISIMIEPLKHEFHLSDSQIGILTGVAYGTSYALAAIPLGMLADRVNRRNLLAFLLTIWSACTALCGMAQNYTSLLIGRVTVGAAESCGYSVSLSLIADLFPSRRRSSAIGIFSISTLVATAIAFALGAVVITHYGWRAAFIIAGVPGFLLALLLRYTVREPVRGAMDEVQEDDKRAPSLGKAIAYFRENPLLLQAAAAIVLATTAQTAVNVWLASQLIRVYGFSLTQAGFLVGGSAAIFGALGSFLGGIFGDLVAKRLGTRYLPLVPCLTTLIAFATGVMLAMGSNIYVGVATLILFELFGRMHNGPAYNILISHLRPRMRGVSLSTLSSLNNLIGTGVGPMLVGVISDLVGGYKAIRYGLLATMFFFLWASFHFYMMFRGGTEQAPAPAPAPAH